MSRILCFAPLLGLAVLLATVYADDQPKSAGDDLKLVPTDASIFATIRLAEFLSTESGKKLLPTARKLFEDDLKQLEQLIGVPLADIERLTIVESKGEPGLIVRTAKPYDLDKLIAKARKEEFQDKIVYMRKNAPPVYIAGNRVFGVGGPVDAMIKAESSKAEHPNAQTLKIAAAGKHHVVAGVRPEGFVPLLKLDPQGEGKKLSRDELLDKVPPDFLPYKPLLRAKWATITIDASKEIKAELVSQFNNSDEAEEAETAAKTARYVGREALRSVKAKLDNDKDEDAKETLKLVELAHAGLKSAKVSRDKNQIRVSLSTGIEVDLLVAAVAQMRIAAAKMTVQNDLKQIALAMHNYHDVNGHFPAAITDDDGKALLSWRVAILPYIEQDHIYKQFRLNEAWDSAHNKKLLKEMPKLFAPKYAKVKDASSTYYRVFSGKDAPFDLTGKLKRKFTDITDGTSNTFMIVEASEAADWTKPEGLEYDANKPLPKLGAQFPEVFMVAFFDGSVRAIKKKVADATLRALITPSGGEVIQGDY